ncbi:GNAT family N-acetyltransferase [Streptomyces lomondensis]|uniref:Acetyltransferase n=1 Tax=Streptomyces lomondensis TaxID=68229 RepID=A0ABQ2XAS5_9ACTN|nr:GNAT family N-acetyltransferase [Streptomyces lomondensis]MCF0077007.1 GNAT family N-acetyltransferase [Streptomyces lomondensis]GGX07382.1 acetyltransferase [Streptomyces lomondensis]
MTGAARPAGTAGSPTPLLRAAATASAPALLLRPWRQADAACLVELCRDEALRRWVSVDAHDHASAARWVEDQRRGREAGHRFAFAVVEVQDRGDEGELAGHVVLKNVAPGAPTAEVGYWTAAHARGRGVAPRALRALTDWAFTAFADDGPAHLELLHQVDNTASCRVAHKCGYDQVSLLPAAPPAFPRDGHRHVRSRTR